MGTDSTTDKQSISVIVMYIIGTSSLVIFALDSKKDLWISILICYVITIFMSLIVGRLKQLLPDKDFFQIIQQCYGKIFSKIVLVIYFVSAFYIVVLINTFLIHFIRLTSLPHTPKIALAIPITIICLWMVKGGVELISRFATLFIIPVLLFIIILIVMVVPQMNFDNLKPAFQEKPSTIFHGSLSTFIFPLGELVVFSAFFKRFSKPKASYKVLLIGSTIGTIVVFIISVTDVLVLGIDLASSVYYPTYVVASRITIGDFIHGIEIIICIVFIVGAFVKTNVYFTICCKAVARTFGFNDDYKFITTPIGLLLLSASIFFYAGPLDYTPWLKRNLVLYSIPYIIIFPILTLIIAEIKKTNPS